MKLKLMYFLPFALGVLFYIPIVLIGEFKAVNPLAWVALLFLLIAGILMLIKKWWGSIFGILVGLLLIYMGSQDTGQFINETPLGVIFVAYYLIFGIVSLIKKIKKAKATEK
ncbi:MAG: hypothetical protein QM266_05990 [Bacillota bacterium]|nr:hypothetical protein [Bacillota bacterium]